MYVIYIYIYTHCMYLCCTYVCIYIYMYTYIERIYVREKWIHQYQLYCPWHGLGLGPRRVAETASTGLRELEAERAGLLGRTGEAGGCWWIDVDSKLQCMTYIPYICIYHIHISITLCTCIFIYTYTMYIYIYTFIHTRTVCVEFGISRL